MVEPADHLLTVDMGRGRGQGGQKTRENPLDFPFKQEVHLAQFLFHAWEKLVSVLEIYSPGLV
jgi:hypothetical protein